VANIFELNISKKQSALKRVCKKPKIVLRQREQLDLFEESQHASNIIIMPSTLTPFEEALILDEKGDAKAKKAYIKAIDASDCEADAYCNLGIIEYENGNTVKAIDSFTKSLRSEPRHFESHFNLANLYSELGNLPLSKIHYEFACELDPDSPDIRFNLGILYANTRDFDSAMKILSEYRKMVSPEDGAVAENLIESIRKFLAG